MKEKIIMENENYEYFICYSINGKYNNTSYVYNKFIESIDDIRIIESELQNILGSTTEITIINYRIF